MNIAEFFKEKSLSDLSITDSLRNKLQATGIATLETLYGAIKLYKMFGTWEHGDMLEEDAKDLDRAVTELMIQCGLIKKPSPQPPPSVRQPISQPRGTQRMAAQKPIRTPKSQPNPNRSSSPTGGSLPPDDQKGTGISEPEQSTGQIQSDVLPLRVWEQRLAPLVKQVELVGEIPITKAEVSQLAQEFQRLFYRRGIDEVCEEILEYYPASFLVFLVSQGIYGYLSGDYWDAVKSSLNNRVNVAGFGRLSERILRRFGLPRFEDLQKRSMRYVTPLLAHGGIPMYCLGDFFEHVVLPSIDCPEYSGLTGVDLVDELLDRSSVQIHTDKPVLYFLEVGGKTAADLVERSRSMVQSWRENQQVMSAEDAGLPPHWVSYFYDEWVEQHFASVSRSEKYGNRLARPYLCLDPWGLGVFLYLPAQPVSAGSIGNVSWEVEAGDYHETIRTRVMQNGDRMVTKDITIRLADVVDQYLVRFTSTDQDTEWKIRGFSREQPCLFFNLEDGKLQRRISASISWLLYPGDCGLQIIDGNGEPVENLPRLPGEWSKFRAECWDLTQTRKIRITGRDLDWSAQVRSNEPIVSPELVGGGLLPTDRDEDPVPVYSADLPEIKIPISRTEDAVRERERWRITIESQEAAEPSLSTNMLLSELPPDAVKSEEEFAILSLVHPRMLGKRPIGTFQVSIKGPLGRDAVFVFRCIPDISVVGVDDLYIPTDGGNNQPVILIKTKLTDRVEPTRVDRNIKIRQSNPGQYEIVLGGEETSVRLNVNREILGGEVARIPISLRIKKFRWRLVEGSGPADRWITRGQPISMAEMFRSETPLLIIDIPDGLQSDLTFGLRLYDIQGQELRVLKPPQKNSGTGRRFCRFDLSDLYNTLQSSDSPMFRLELFGRRVLYGPDEFKIPVYLIKKDLGIMRVKGETYTSDTTHHIMIGWQQKYPIRSRTLYMWPKYRPWKEVIAFDIPDSDKSEFEFIIPRARDTGGVYIAQVTVVDPWVNLPPPQNPPDLTISGTGVLEISTLQARLAFLEKQISCATVGVATQLADRIEAALIRHELNDESGSWRDLSWCCGNLYLASPQMLLSIEDVLSGKKFPDLLNVMGRNLADPVVLKKVLSAVKAGVLSQDDFRRLCRHLSQSNEWPIETCVLLLEAEDVKTRIAAVKEIIARDIGVAVDHVLKMVGKGILSVEDATELLADRKALAQEQLRKNPDNQSISVKILHYLSKYNYYSGVPVVRVGNWVNTNAGWGRIDSIINLSTHTSVDRYLNEETCYLLNVSLHLEMDESWVEKVQINLLSKEILFARTTQVYRCHICNEFATGRRDQYRSHMYGHPAADFTPPDQGNTLPLLKMSYSHARRQKRSQ